MTALPIVLMTEDEVAAFGRGEGGFGVLQSERGALPLAAMDVDARVVGVLASIEVAQTFVNTTGVAIEATYMFPLPDRAAVHRFRMEVNGRVVEGVVEERGQARAQYDAAIAAGHRAAITEQERSDVFTLRVGNLMPGERALVRLSLVGPLAIDDGEVTFRFPLVVAPRYMPGAALGGEQAGLGLAEDTTLVPDASRISPPVRLPGLPNPVRLGLRVALEDRGLRDVASSLHAVIESVRDARVIEVQPGERLDRDFILRWRVSEGELRSELACADDADGRGGTFMLTFVPPANAALAAKPRDVVFVIDRSGSMSGWKMVAARRAVARMIDTLTSRDRFQVVAFDNAVEVLPEAGLAPATDRNRFTAVEALARIDARGGTELAAPLSHAVGALAGGHDDRARVVVLVTDGQVGNEDHVLQLIAPNLRNVRVFTLGIDQAVNAGFLRRLAGIGGGLCELVESEDRLDAVMAKVHRRIGTPIATELAIRGASGLELEAASIAPRRLPDVYAGAPVVVLGRYRGAAPTSAAIEVAGTSFGDPLKLAVTRAPVAAGASWLAASWARANIRELEDRYAIGEHGVEGEIVRVSKAFGVLSRFTAYLAIDRGEIANKTGRPHPIVQSVDAPAGWDLERAVTSTATGSVHRSRMVGGAMAMPPAPAMPAPAQPIGAPPRIFAQGKMKADGATPGAPPPPAAASRVSRPPSPARGAFTGNAYHAPRREAADHIGESAPPADLTAYLASLAQLARELAAQASGRCDAAAVRLLRQRLEEWIEDVRSVGADARLAQLVEHQVKRLSAALALATSLATEAAGVATELAKLATGAPPPQGRAFWK
jgi:Ca-activated chloride channel family protein